MRTEKIILTDRQRNWLIKHYKHTKNDEVMAKLGLTIAGLHRFARELGLKKSRQFMQRCQAATTEAARIANKARGWPPKGYRIPRGDEFGFKKGVTSAERLGPERNRERIRKAAESRRKTVAAEKRRILFGLPQRTKLKIGYSRMKVHYRYELRKHGYQVAKGANEAFVVDGTVRSLAIEERAIKHGIRIINPSNTPPPKPKTLYSNDISRTIR